MSTLLAVKAIRVQNYKSLRDAEMQIGSPITVLVGRNNSGKSNVLDLFDFIKAASIDVSEAVKRRGANMRNLVWGNLPSEEAQITIDFDVPDELRQSAIGFISERHPTAPNGTGVGTRLTREAVANSPFLKTLRYELRFGQKFREAISTTHAVRTGDRYALAERL